MKILQICSYYIDSPLYQNLFDALEKQGIEEDVYVFAEKNYILKKVLPNNVVLSKCFTNFDRYIFHLKHFKVLKDIKTKLNLKNYDLMHAHSLFSNGYIAYKLFKKFNIPYVVTVRATDVYVFFKKLKYLRGTGINILEDAKSIIFLSRPLREFTMNNFIPEYMKKSLLDKSYIVNNGIDYFWFNNLNEKTCIDRKSVVKLIFAGRIDSKVNYIRKNVTSIIETCNILQRKGYSVSLKIIGNPYSKDCLELWEKYIFIEHIPFCNKTELLEHYRSSYIFITPSVTETFGLVYAEAMTQGLPVIYTKNQGFDGIFEDGEVGYSVNCYDTEYISECVLKIMENYDNISSRCTELSHEFDWKKKSSEIINIYKFNPEKK